MHRFILLVFPAAALALAACTATTTPTTTSSPTSNGDEPSAGEGETTADEGLPAPKRKDAGASNTTDAGTTSTGTCVASCSGTRECKSTISDNVKDITFTRKGTECVGSSTFAGITDTFTMHCDGTISASASGLAYHGDWEETDDALVYCFIDDYGDRNCSRCPK